MTMNLVGQQKLFEVPSSMKNMDEDIVYSMIERHSGKASQPTTTRSSTTSSLIFRLHERGSSLSRVPFYWWNIKNVHSNIVEPTTIIGVGRENS